MINELKQLEINALAELQTAETEEHFPISEQNILVVKDF